MVVDKRMVRKPTIMVKDVRAEYRLANDKETGMTYVKLQSCYGPIPTNFQR